MAMVEPESVKTTVSAAVYERIVALTDREMGVTIADIVRRCIVAGLPLVEAPPAPRRPPRS